MKSPVPANPGPEGLSHRVDAVVDAAIAAGQIVGAVVMVAQDGQVVHRGTYGMADRERELPMRPDTLFRWASLTKAVTSAAAALMIDHGVVGLDEPVTTYLPVFQPKLADGTPAVVTVRHLMTHTSGLTYRFAEPADGPYHRLGVSDGLDQPGLSLSENLRRLKDAPLIFAPGTAWNYSLSTDVLGGVLEAAAGQPLPKLLNELILEPQGMTSTAFQPIDAERLAAPYGDGERGAVRMSEHHDVAFGEGAISFAPDRYRNDRSYPSGGSGLIGPAQDFLRLLEWVRKAIQDGAGGPTLRRLATVETGRLATFQPGWGWSLGWAVLFDPALAGTPQSPGSWLWGGVYGSSWFVDPVKRISVVSMTNTGVAGMLGPFPDALRDAVYDRSPAR